MRAGKLLAVLAAVALLWPRPVMAQEDLRAEIDQIKQQLSQMDELKAKLAELETKLEESEKARTEESPQPESINTSYNGVKAKVDGRFFVGIVDGGDQSNDDWSTDISDAKLRFTFDLPENIRVFNRLSLTSAKTAEIDYLYLDYPKGITPYSVTRLGQRKMDIGEETWGDDPAESVVISNSVPHIGGYAIGVAFNGRFNESPASPRFELGFVNGARGEKIRPTSGLPINAKIGVPLPNNFYASTSYFDSARMGGADKSAVSVAEIIDAPTGATEWRRRIWELDLRYNAGNSGFRAVIPSYDLPKFMAGAMYGTFRDDATGADGRDGNFWYIEGLYRLTDKLYTGARYSALKLDDGVLAALGRSPVAVNSYKRTSIGLGYILSDLTHLKTEYSFNDTSGGSSDPSLNQWAVGVASKF